MAPAATFRWCAAVLALMLCLLVSPSMAIYCDEDDCYEPESRQLFVKIANAYEILKDEATREQYDYAIAHPEEVFYNTARYYRAYYGHKTDPRAVLVGLLLILSAFQYLNQWTRYNQAVEMVKKTPAYKNRLRALELERSGGTTNKKKTNRQPNKKIEEDASYLTQRSLGVPFDAWRNIDDSTKEDLVHRRLWEKSNLESYLSESRKESKRRR